MATAFVLLNVNLGMEDEVLAGLREIVGIREAHQVFGVYDIIARFEADYRRLRPTQNELRYDSHAS